MEKEHKKKALDIAKSGIKVTFSTIPIVGSLISELIAYFDAECLERRLIKLEKSIEDHNIKLETFTDKLRFLDEHEYYVVRNALKHLCITVQPEVVDAFNKAIIDYIMQERRGIPEEACEILSQLNANDIRLLKSIKTFIEKKSIEENNNQIDDNININSVDESIERSSSTGYKMTVWQDRNIKYGNKTIMWEEFSQINLTEQQNSKKPDLGFAINSKLIRRNGDVFYDFAYEARSFLKLQNLGVLHFDFVNTTGFISMLNIDRFHISLFGEKLLEYID